MIVCEICKTKLDHKNRSPSEIHDFCIECWLKHPESKGFRKRLEETRQQHYLDMANGLAEEAIKEAEAE